MDSSERAREPSLGDVQREAFERFEREIRAVPLDKLRTMNVDAYAAAELVLQAAPRYLALRPRMGTLAPELNLALVDACAPLAHAYCYASQKYVVHRDARPLSALREDAIALRSRLRGTLALLEASGHVRVYQLSALRSDTSYCSLSHDLTSLGRLFNENWAELSGILAVSREDLEQSGVLAGQLLESNTVRDERARALRTFALLAHQAFTAFCDAYDEVRRAVIFLRSRDGDAEEIAPSLYSLRKRRARNSKRDEELGPALSAEETSRPEADDRASVAAQADRRARAPDDDAAFTPSELHAP